MAEGAYSAGTVYLQVVPSFRDVQNAIRGDANRVADAFGGELNKRGDGIGEDFGKSISKGADKELGKAGKKSAEKYAGHFQTVLASRTRDAFKQLGDDVDKELSKVGADLKDFKKFKIGLDIDDDEAIALVESLKAELDKLSNEHVSIEVRTNAAAAASELAGFLETVHKVDGETAVVDVEVRTKGGTLDNLIRSQLAKAGTRTGEIKVDLDLNSAEAELAVFLEQLRDLEAHVGVDVDTGHVLTDLVEIKAAIEAIDASGHNDIEFVVNRAAVLADVEKIFVEIEALTAKPQEVRITPDLQIAPAEISAFAALVKTRVKAALMNFPAIDLTVNTDDVLAQVGLLRARLAALQDVTVGVDISDREALAEIAALGAAFARLDHEKMRPEVVLQARQALAELAAVELAVRPLDGKDINLNVDLKGVASFLAKLRAVSAALKGASGDGDGAANSFRVFNGILVAAITLGPILVPILAAIGGGLVALGTAALGVGAGLGVLVLALSGIIGAVKALGDVQKNASKDALANEKAVRTASNSVRDAERGLARAREQGAQSAAAAARTIADAERTLTRARADAVRAAEDSARSVANAEQAVVDAEVSTARTRQELNRRQAQATADLAEARARAVRQAESDARAVDKAETALANARLSADRDLVDSGKKVTDAQRAASKARLDAAQANASAARAVVSAETAITTAQTAARRAQEALTDARRAASQELEDLSYRLREGVYQEQDAVASLAEAQKQYDRVMARPVASQKSKDEVTNRLGETKLALEEIRTQNKRTAEEKQRADAKGVEGSDQVVGALENIEKANAAVEQAADNFKTAQQKRDETTVEGADRVAAAERSVSEAIDDRARKAVDAAASVASAEESLASAREAQSAGAVTAARAVLDAQTAIRDLTKQAFRDQVDADRAIGDAQQGVTDALRDQARAAADSAQSIADAQRGVADAQRSAAQSAKSSADSIFDAQQRLTDSQAGYQETLAKTGEIGSGSMQKLKDAMGKLSPAGQDFARFIFGLKDEFLGLRGIAETGILPGLQKGIEALVTTYGPGFRDFIKTMSDALGGFLDSGLKALTDPVWRDFFSTIGELAPVFTGAFGKAGMELLKGLAAIATAFAPVAVDLAFAVASLATSFADWAAGLKDSKGFQSFIDYLVKNGPLVAKFFGDLVLAIVNIAKAVAPFASDLLAAIDGALQFIAAMDPKTLGLIVTVVLALVLAFQLGALAVAIVSGAFSILFAPLAAVVAGIVLVSVALFILWQRSETARDIMKAAFKVIQTAVEFLGNAFVYLWKNVIVPAFLAISGAISNFWDKNGERILRNAKMSVDFWAAAVEFLWKKIIVPGFEAISTAISVAWKIISPILGFFLDVLAAGGKGLIWAIGALKAIIELTWAIIGTTISLAWNKVIEPVLNKFLKMLGIDGLSGLFDIVKGAGETAFSALQTAVEKLSPVFETVVKAISAAWNTLKDLFREPVYFVLDTIINKGLIGTFNKIATKFGTSSIDPFPIPDFLTPTDKKAPKERHADGGQVQGPWRGAKADNVLGIDYSGVPTTWVNPREYVHSVAAVDYYGTDFMDAINKRKLPRFADGGAVGGIGSKVGGAVKGISSGAKKVVDVVTNPTDFIKESFDSVLKKLVSKIPGGEFAEVLAAVPVAVGKMLLSKAVGAVKSLLPSFGGDSDPDGKGWLRPVNGPFGEPIGTKYGGTGYASHTGQDFPVDTGNAVLSSLAGVVTAANTIGYRASDRWHGEGLGSYGRYIRVDHGNGMDSLYAHLSSMKVSIGDTVGRGQLIGLSGSAGNSSGPHLHFEITKNGAYQDPRPYLTGAKMYDQGGMLPPGLTTVLNATGKPEPVFNPEQWKTLQSAVGGGGSVTSGAQFHGNVYTVDVDELTAKIQTRQRDAAVMNNLSAIATGG